MTSRTAGLPEAASSAPRGDLAVPAVRHTLSRQRAEDTANLLRVVSDPTRLQLLSLIQYSAGGRARVGDLTTSLGLRQPTVSHHLKIMAEAGIVNREPVGREAWFSIVPERLEAIADLLR